MIEEHIEVDWLLNDLSEQDRAVLQALWEPKEGDLAYYRPEGYVEQRVMFVTQAEGYGNLSVWDKEKQMAYPLLSIGQMFIFLDTMTKYPKWLAGKGQIQYVRFVGDKQGYRFTMGFKGDEPTYNLFYAEELKRMLWEVIVYVIREDKLKRKKTEILGTGPLSPQLE